MDANKVRITLHGVWAACSMWVVESSRGRACQLLLLTPFRNFL